MSKFEEIKELLGLSQVASLFNIDWPCANGRGRCPFCGSSTAFKVSKDRHYICYRCDKKGSVFDLLMDSGHAANFKESLVLLSRHVDQSDSKREYTRRLTAIEKIFKVYVDNAEKHKDIIESYTLSRGWSRLPIVGLATGDCLAKAGVTDAEMTSAGINCDYDGYTYYNNHIVFPVYNSWGKLVHFHARAMDDRDLRWKASKGKPSVDNYFFNSKALYDSNSKYLTICEGVSDAISLMQMGESVIGQFGVNVRLLPFAEQFSKFDYLVFAYDRDKYDKGTDKAGEYKSWGMMMPHVIDLLAYIRKPAYFLKIPNRSGIKDINDWLLDIEYDPEEYNDYLSSNHALCPIDILAIEMYKHDIKQHSQIWRLLSATGSPSSARTFLEYVVKKELGVKSDAHYLLDLFGH